MSRVGTEVRTTCKGKRLEGTCLNAKGTEKLLNKKLKFELTL